MGTAYSALSEVWFTLARGNVNEVYYPTVDRPQVRDLQLLVGDGESFVVGERELDVSYAHIGNRTLGFAVTLADPAGRFRQVKEVIAAPYHLCLLLRVRLESPAAALPGLRVTLANPADPHPNEGPDRGTMVLCNQPPGAPSVGLGDRAGGGGGRL